MDQHVCPIEMNICSRSGRRKRNSTRKVKPYILGTRYSPTTCTNRYFTSSGKPFRSTSTCTCNSYSMTLFTTCQKVLGTYVKTSTTPIVATRREIIPSCFHLYIQYVLDDTIYYKSINICTSAQLARSRQ